jgi:hypothetical protein
LGPYIPAVREGDIVAVTALASHSGSNFTGPGILAFTGLGSYSGRFQKRALLKARTQSRCVFYLRLARAFKSTVLADLIIFCSVSQSPCFSFFSGFSGGRKSRDERDCPAIFKGCQKWYQSIDLPLIYQRFTLNSNFIRPP